MHFKTIIQVLGKRYECREAAKLFAQNSGEKWRVVHPPVIPTRNL